MPNANAGAREPDPAYLQTRDHVTKQPARRGLEKAWKAYGDLLPEKPEQFVSEFRRDFAARAWELYVVRWLARSGATPIRAPGAGPDFCADHPRIGRFWVECVVPTAGHGTNKVWQRTTENSWSGPPDGPIQLRYTSAIEAKIQKIRKYREKGIVQPKEPVLIALNQGAIRDSDLNDLELPLAFKVLFGIGPLTMSVEIASGTTSFFVPRQHELKNAKGSSVSTKLFSEQPSHVVAGLLLARSHPIDLFCNRGRYMMLAHNPLAHASVPVAALPLRGELWVEQGLLLHRGKVAGHGPYAKKSRRLPGDALELRDLTDAGS